MNKNIEYLKEEISKSMLTEFQSLIQDEYEDKNTLTFATKSLYFSILCEEDYNKFLKELNKIKSKNRIFDMSFSCEYYLGYDKSGIVLCDIEIKLAPLSVYEVLKCCEKIIETYSKFENSLIKYGLRF